MRSPRVSPSVICYADPRKHKSPKWCGVFAAGCGGRVERAGRLRDGPAALYGSPRLWHIVRALQADGRPWWYADHGYLGQGFYRVTRGALQLSALDQGAPACSARLRCLGVQIEPWRVGGRHILVCPPGEVFARLNGFDAGQWRREILSELKQATDRPIVVRPKETRLTQPLAEDLRDAHALVAYTSNAAGEAVLAGVPVFVTGACAALPMGRSDLSMIESPAQPDGRERWAAWLAANQWNLKETRAGACWRAIGN